MKNNCRPAPMLPAPGHRRTRTAEQTRRIISLLIGSTLLTVPKIREKVASTKADSRVLPRLARTEQLAVRRSIPGPSLVVACPSIERWGVRTALAAGVAGIVTSEDLESALGPCVEAVPSPHARSRSLGWS
jgi:hypothetical protein